MRVKNIDLRVEWANTARNRQYGLSWHRHGIYSTGYNYEGRVIGHHMGTDSRDLFIKAQYHAPEGATFAIEADYEHNFVHVLESESKKRWIAADLYYPLKNGLTASFGAGLEHINNPGGSDDHRNAAGWFRI